MLNWICKLICKIKGHHNFQMYCYGGLGGTYTVEKCSCCGYRNDDSFKPISREGWE